MTDGQPTRLTNEALLAGLAAHAVELEKTAKELRESYRFSRWLKSTIAIGVVLIAGLVVVALLNLSNGGAIRSCTTPGGACYQRGQHTTSTAVAQIVAEVNAHTDRVFIASLQCSGHPMHSPAFTRCLRAKGVG